MGSEITKKYREGKYPVVSIHNTFRTAFVYFGEFRRKIGAAITTKYITSSLRFPFGIPSNHCSLKLNHCHLAAAELKLNSSFSLLSIEEKTIAR